MDYWHGLPTGSKTPDVINMIVEIPKGSQNKYEYDKRYGIFKLDRVLFSPFHYPGDYGLIPQTLAEDNDPLDALVLVTHPTKQGTLIECRPIGVLEMVDNNENDDKILCVPIGDIRFDGHKDLKDLPEHYLKEIAHFFEAYKHLEGKKVKILGWKDAGEAKKIILESVERYQKKFKK
ncbi:MAG: inorganic diphosphatase [Nanoarchaeota archaeon]|nr:inorganic diphosphatase [Nanoarchaeota archaeon]